MSIVLMWLVSAVEAACTITSDGPADGAARGPSPRFRWTGGPDCVEYRVELSPTGDFAADATRSQWREQTAWRMNEAEWVRRGLDDLAGGVYWRVKGRDALGDVVRGPVRFLEVDAARLDLRALPEGPLFARMHASKEVIREPGVGAPAGDSDAVLSIAEVSESVIAWRWVVLDSDDGAILLESADPSPTFTCPEGGRGGYDVELSVSDGETVATFRERRLLTCTLPRVADGRPEVYLDLTAGSYLQNGKINGSVVQPGTLVHVSGDISQSWVMLNFVGTESEPIHFVNDGLVRNTDTGKLLHLVNSRHVIVDGRGDDAHTYGIELANTLATGEQGLFVRSLEQGTNPLLGLTNIEIFGVAIGPNPGTALEVNTKGSSGYNRNNWTMEGLQIHHVRVEDVTHEGFYLGYTRDWIGASETHYAYKIDDAKIYRNTIERTGWDGLQVAQMGPGLEVHDNLVTGSGLDDVAGQSSSFQWNSGSTGAVFKNRFHDGTGSNLQAGCTGGDAVLYGNVWAVGPGTGDHLLYLQAGLAAGTDYRFVANTFVTGEGHVLGVNMTSPGCNETGTSQIAMIQLEDNAVVFPDSDVGSEPPAVLDQVTGTGDPAWTDAPNATVRAADVDDWCPSDPAAWDFAPTCDTSPLLDGSGVDPRASGLDPDALPGGSLVDHDGRVLGTVANHGAWQAMRAP